jgi:predicted CXXCH cytochrome family protein
VRAIKGLASALVIGLGACTNETIVYRDREPFNAPKDSVNGFLGYYSASTKQTSCGNCHVEKQAGWTQTAHSRAWQSLSASGHQQATCNGCHSVSEKGNAVLGAAGYNSKADSSYHDVQCESCHGPGFQHASNPGLGNLPQAKMVIPTATAAFDTSATCASCHSGAHEPFADQWLASGHAGVVSEVIDEYVANPVGEAACMACHEGRLTLKAWGVNTRYAEVNDAITAANAMPVTCVVCHDPHSNRNQKQLRWSISDPNPDNNLCTKCHNRRSEPQATSYRGPHAPQGGVLFGTAGWWPAGYDTTALVATHGNPAANTRLCATCHVTRFTVNDKLTGQFSFQSVGHLFSPDPCLDGQGKPTGDNTCKRPGDAGYVSGSRAFVGCAGSGCHSSTATAENAFNAIRSSLKVLADQLWKDNDGDGVFVTWNTTTRKATAFDPGDTGLLMQVPLAEYDYGDRKITVAEGSLYNAELVGEGLYANGDGSFGVHNPFLAQTLLAASINAMKATYMLPAPPQAQRLLDRIEREHLRARMKDVVTRQ